jgi:hypothetical protein
MPQRAARHPYLKSHLATGLACALALFAPAAQAHVKWFSKVVNCVSVPLSPVDVISAPFCIVVCIAAVLAMLAVFMVDRRVSPRFEQWNTTFARQRRLVTQGAAHLLRIGVAVYFVLLMACTGDQYMILTPVLGTTASWVPLLQALSALTVLWRRTALLAATGITGLFVYVACFRRRVEVGDFFGL